MSAAVIACPCCRGSGRASARALVKVKEALADGALCVAVDTVYENHHSGRWPWLTRVGPSGRRGRDLWIVVAEALQFGQPVVARRLLNLAMGGEGR